LEQNYVAGCVSKLDGESRFVALRASKDIALMKQIRKDDFVAPEIRLESNSGEKRVQYTIRLSATGPAHVSESLKIEGISESEIGARLKVFLNTVFPPK
jgi:hypothetical protein